MKEPTFDIRGSEKINKPKSAENKSDQHFHMSDEYERHSSSQKTIGHQVIDSTLDFSEKEIKNPDVITGIDLACGPGNLTIELKEKLERKYPNSKINLSGLDYTEENIKRLTGNSNGEINGITGSFYELPVKPESMDVITSNEGLHWQPPYEMDEIIYSHLGPEEREKYESWAKNNFKKAIKNVFESLKEDGIAVLQFGHEGQLQKLWDLIKSTLEETQFQDYKSNVNFPLYYPSMSDIKDAFLEAGFTDDNIKIDGSSQDLTEETPEEITGFLKAFTKPGFSTFFKPDDLEDFYSSIEKKLSETDINNFRKDQWHRTLIKVKK